jgi:ketosteroid isomerase-like protein
MLRFFASLLLLCLLHSPARADERLPAYLVRLPDSVATVFVAETSMSALHRFDNLNGQPEHIGQTYMSIGQNGDGKQKSGDRRTPLGIYFVTEQLDTSRMHEKYGASAFVLDYPNVLDKQSGKTGDGIWVHGVDARGGKRPPLDTDGCIALPNEDLAEMAALFRSNTTPVLVGRELKWSDPGEIEALRLELEAAIAAWAASLKRGDMQAHLALYGEDFRHWTMNKPDWSVLVRETLGRRPITDVTVSELLLLADPNDEGLYLSRFGLTIIEGNQTFASTKRLYWRRSVSGVLLA